MSKWDYVFVGAPLIISIILLFHMIFDRHCKRHNSKNAEAVSPEKGADILPFNNWQ